MGKSVDTKRIRFGIAYKGGVRFVKEVVEDAVELKSLECVSVDELHYVLLTLAKPYTTSSINDAILKFNEKAEEGKRLEVVPFEGADIVTFAKAQGYMQHPFYAPFEAAKSAEKEGGSSSYWVWTAPEDGASKRVSKELESDFVEGSIKPTAEKRQCIAPGRTGSATMDKKKKRRMMRKQLGNPASLATFVPTDVLYEMAKCKDETIRAKNYAIQLLETMLKAAPAVANG